MRVKRAPFVIRKLAVQIGGQPGVDFVVNRRHTFNPLKREQGEVVCAWKSERASENSAQRAVSQTQGVFDGAIIHLFEIAQCERGPMEFRQRCERGLQSLIQSTRVRPARFDRFGQSVPTKEQCGVCEKRRAPCVAQRLRARQEIFQDRALANAFSTLLRASPARRPLLPRGFAECRKRWRKVSGYGCE